MSNFTATQIRMMEEQAKREIAQHVDHLQRTLGFNISSAEINQLFYNKMKEIEEQMVGGSYKVPPAPMPISGMATERRVTKEYSLEQMVSMRLHKNVKAVFDFFAIHKINEDRFVVFVVKGDQHATLEDGALFPSDQLVTQLGILIN